MPAIFNLFLILRTICQLDNIAYSTDSGGLFLAPCLHMLDSVVCPPSTKARIFFWPHVCKVPNKHLLQTLRFHMRSIGTLGQLFQITPHPCHPTTCLVQGEGLFPDFVLCVESLYFCYIGPHKKFQKRRKHFKIPPFRSKGRGEGGE